jgi:hypothetical protein
MSESGKPASKRQMQLLVGLGAVLAALFVFQVLPMMTGGDTPAANRPTGTAATGAGAAGTGSTGAAAAQRRGRGLDTVEDVRLAKLEQEWPAPGETRRNPFTMAPAPPPPSAAAASAAAAKPAEPVVTIPTGPPPPPPIPPITLKFIGVISSDSLGKIAGLSDGKFVYRGREGQTIEGRYRIVKIGEESIQLEYVNGTGRQTIRLSGK